MNPQITPKGKKTKPMFLETNAKKNSNQKPKIPKGNNKTRKYMKSKERKSSKDAIRDKLNQFIQTKY